MTAPHKAALATGRAEGRAVQRYLEAISQPKRPGRKKTAESINRQLDIDGRLATASASEKLRLIQQRFDLKAHLDQLPATSNVDLDGLESSFVNAAATSYGERKGISYAAWREVGVPAEILHQAGIRRARS